ncbi:hypothetical protein LCGC14_3083860, partial [marine sediment metagenome]
MAKTLQQRVIEIITALAISRVATQRELNWDDIEDLFDTGPKVDEKWFWDNFGSMVTLAENQISGAV